MIHLNLFFGLLFTHFKPITHLVPHVQRIYLLVINLQHFSVAYVQPIYRQLAQQRILPSFAVTKI
ncbi:hypothetical protein AB4298_04365 [Shewanella sp. 10N.261.52.F9]|uniref:hypothetical protein n=1 Tax=Shewanella sp. 10N.261.52.F9 TaxID=3229684 RepID=UPI0035503CFC